MQCRASEILVGQAPPAGTPCHRTPAGTRASPCRPAPHPDWLSPTQSPTWQLAADRAHRTRGSGAIRSPPHQVRQVSWPAHLCSWRGSGRSGCVHAHYFDLTRAHSWHNRPQSADAAVHTNLQQECAGRNTHLGMSSAAGQSPPAAHRKSHLKECGSQQCRNGFSSAFSSTGSRNLSGDSLLSGRMQRGKQQCLPSNSETTASAQAGLQHHQVPTKATAAPLLWEHHNHCSRWAPAPQVLPCNSSSLCQVVTSQPVLGSGKNWTRATAALPGVHLTQASAALPTGTSLTSGSSFLKSSKDTTLGWSTP